MPISQCLMFSTPHFTATRMADEESDKSAESNSPCKNKPKSVAKLHVPIARHPELCISRAQACRYLGTGRADPKLPTKSNHGTRRTPPCHFSTKTTLLPQDFFVSLRFVDSSLAMHPKHFTVRCKENSVQPVALLTSAPASDLLQNKARLNVTSAASASQGGRNPADLLMEAGPVDSVEGVVQADCRHLVR